MTNLRTAAQQAIGLICRARLCEINSMSSRQEMLRLLIEATDTLRAALAQQSHTDDLNQRIKLYVGSRCAPPQQAEPFTPDAIRTTQTAWKMGYDAAKAETQQAEPVQKPVGTVRVGAGEVHIVPLVRDADRSPLKDGQPVYAAPPQRKPLTDEEIPALAEQVLKLSVYYDVWALLGTDGLVTLVRAVEQAHGIKE